MLAAGDGDGLVHIGGIGLDNGIIPGKGVLGSAVLGIARGGDDDAALGQVQGHGLFLFRVDLHGGEGEEKCETQKQGKCFFMIFPPIFPFLRKREVLLANERDFLSDPSRQGPAAAGSP